jgi:hypothetical protein
MHREVFCLFTPRDGMQNNGECKKMVWAIAQALYYRSHFHGSTLHHLFLLSTQSLTRPIELQKRSIPHFSDVFRQDVITRPG